MQPLINHTTRYAATMALNYKATNHLSCTKSCTQFTHAKHMPYWQ